jgi:hypothetical protein
MILRGIPNLTKYTAARISTGEKSRRLFSPLMCLISPVSMKLYRQIAIHASEMRVHSLLITVRILPPEAAAV